MVPRDVRPTAVVVNDDPTERRVWTQWLAEAGLEAHPFDSAEHALAGIPPDRPPALVAIRPEVLEELAERAGIPAGVFSILNGSTACSRNTRPTSWRCTTRTPGCCT